MRKWWIGVAVLYVVTLMCRVDTPDAQPGFDTLKACKVIFRNEGGYQCDRKDSGNWTGGKVGVGKLVGTAPGGIAGSVYYRYYRDVLHKTMKQGTLTDAALIYDRDYARPLHLEQIKSQWLGTMILDTAINCGAGTAAVLVARTINVLNGKGEDFPVDPVLGPAEVQWINEYTATRWYEGEKDKTRRALFGSVFKDMRDRRYAAIARHDPAKLRYLPGWIERGAFTLGY